MKAAELLERDFATLDQLVAAYARERPDRLALIEGDAKLDYGSLDVGVGRVAAALRRDGVGAGGVAAICAATSIDYVVCFLGILRAGAAAAPLSPSATPEVLAGMIADCGASVLFLDAGAAEVMAAAGPVKWPACIALDSSGAGTRLDAWLASAAAAAAVPDAVIAPGDPFNIIYSSGTTGVPKGIVQPHAMRWNQIKSRAYDADAVTMISTPLYSNTTLVSVLPTLGGGGTLVLMPKFEAGAFLRLAAQHGATHAMLVPVQYRRVMAHPEFERFDLSSFRLKFATSAPFAAALKADVLRRWPGGLVEYYGMTEGGGACALAAHEFPDKLHTVGRPMEGHDIRLIDEEGREVAAGCDGEVVGRSPSMMLGYHNRPDASRAAEWYSPEGLRFIRTGDIGRFDADGFLVLFDRKKDMIISGGFNIYPSDLEAAVNAHPAVEESAVVGVPSERWGETPVAFVRLRAGAVAAPSEVQAFANGRVGSMQRLADLRLVAALPRNALGKVLKRELREGYRDVVP